MTSQKRFRISRRTLLKGTAVAAPAAIGAACPPSRFRWSPLTAARARTLSAPRDPQQELVEGNTTFAFDLYAEFRQNAEGNLLFSPYSISQALAMTYAGAGGKTAAQMAAVLGFALDQSALHAAFSALNTDLVDRGNSPVDPNGELTARALQIANALWGEQTYPFSEAYSAQLEQSYGAGLHESDFIHAPEEARVEINDWVAEQTEQHIQNIVPEGDITPDTRLVLANAIYFYGSWYVPFDSGNTSDADFFLLDGTTVSVPFMFRHDHLNYARGDGFQAIRLSYAGDGTDTSGFAFVVIMPDEGQFEQFEKGLTVGRLNDAIGQWSSTEVLLYLPKFKFEFGAKLSDVLQALGMVDAFDADRADFSRMVDGTPPEPLFISEVLHKAFISVDENGTEAAAATIVEMAAGAAPPAEEPPEVRIDRPFIFAIRDTTSGTLLFLGRVMDPSA